MPGDTRLLKRETELEAIDEALPAAAGGTVCEPHTVRDRLPDAGARP